MNVVQFERVGRHRGVGVWRVVVGEIAVGELWRGMHGWYYEEYEGGLRLLKGKDARMAKQEMTKRLHLEGG